MAGDKTDGARGAGRKEMSDWDKPTEDMVNEMLDRKTLIKTQAKEIEKLRAALRDISRQPEGDEESAQAVARAALGEKG